MSTERDELAGIARKAIYAPAAKSLVTHDIADAILAAGYTKPRQVTTVEELDALPAGTAVQTSDSADVVVLRSMFGPWRNQDGGEVSTDDLWRYGTQPFTVIYSPATP